MERPSDPDATADMSGDPSIPGDECWINALPKSLLLRILSCLNARQVVQTCVLSRLWRNLWRSVPRINATPDEFVHMPEDYEECIVLFKKFFSRFLMLRNPSCLDEFRLWYDMPSDTDDYSEDANLWILHALQCNAQSVMVTVRGYALELDLAVFISGCFLRRLQLSSVALPPGFFRQLRTGCKALKYLSLCDCGISDVEITSETLEVLTIDNNSLFAFGEQSTISIPSLVYLELEYYAHERIPLLKNMESLEKACIDTDVDDIHQFFKGLSGVTDLEFLYQGPCLFNVKKQWFPKFYNLRTLKLGGQWCLYPGFYALVLFLQNSPNLENLTLVYSPSKAFHADGRLVGELEERSFSCEHLDTADIVCRQVQEHDPLLDSLVKLLADNGIKSRRKDDYQL